jgi:outer membrane protein assembly factor BamB
MRFQDLMFVGIKGSVVALRRDSGAQVWAARIGSDFVNVTVDETRVFAATRGEIFCLDPLNGKILWHNPLKGYGIGLTTMAFGGNASGSSAAVLGQKNRQDQEAASSAAVTVAVVG